MNQKTQAPKLIDINSINKPDIGFEDSQNSWQKALSQATTNPKQLLETLQLDWQELERQGLKVSEEAGERFKLFATDSYLKKIKKGDWQDPLLRQILPLVDELHEHPSYTIDPLEEKEATVVPGLIHKYHGRALLITNSHCAINCRFCFRKNFPYSDNHYSSKSHDAVFDYLNQHKEISEIILSGGDPLILSDYSLQKIYEQLECIQHIKRVRIHTRIPIVLPERINTELLNIIESSPLKTVLVIHCNHAQELDEHSTQCIKDLKQVCFSLQNQSVLLRGVNDSLQTLRDLQESLFELQVQSYYLHILDKVQGTQHFDIDLAQALKLYHSLEASLPGYMVPKLVQELANKPNKSQILRG